MPSPSEAFKSAVARLPHDKDAYEAALIKVIPALSGKGQKELFFAKNADREYIHKEAAVGYLCFKLGGNYAADFLQEVIDAATKGTSP